MKILIIEGVAMPNFGGAEKSMSSFCSYLSVQGHEVFLVCEEFEAGYGVSYEYVATLNLQPFQDQGMLSYINNLKLLIQFIKKNEIDIILTHCIHIMPLLRLAKIITKIPAIIYFKWVYNFNSIGKINKWGLRGFDTYIATNEFVADYWKSQMNWSVNFEYIPDGIFFPEQTKINPLDDKKVNLLFFGRLYEGKGLHLLLEALAMLPEHYHLTVLGEFKPDDLKNHEVKYHNRIKSLITELTLERRIKMMGRVNNVSDFIEKASLVVVPSIIDDAQPFAILESFAYGCPAIGTTRGGIPFMYNEDDFWYCEPTSDAVKKKIIEVMTIDRQELLSRTKSIQVYVSSVYNKNRTQKGLENICIRTAL